MKANEFRKKTEAELKTELQSLRRAQFNLRMQRGMGQLARNDQVGKTRKDIARLKTVLNERNGKRS